MDITLVSGIIMAICGIGVGILSALFGIGGGMVMVPLLHIGFGLPAAFASGTSLFAILPTSLAGVAARLHDGTIRFKVGLIIGVFGACLSPVGAWVSGLVPGMYAMILTGVFILFTAYKMFRRVWVSRPAALAQANAQAKAGTPAAPARRALVSADAPLPRLVATCGVVGAVVGFLSGYLGLGGGFIVVPVLQGVFGFSMKESSGTSLVSVALFALPAFVAHAVLGHIAWVAGLLLIAGSVVGAKLGAMILKHVNDRMLTGMFGVVLVIAGVIMVARELVG